MSAEVRALFLAVALVLFVVAAFIEFSARNGRSLGFVAAGLAAGITPAFWDAWELATE